MEGLSDPPGETPQQASTVDSCQNNKDDQARENSIRHYPSSENTVSQVERVDSSSSSDGDDDEGLKEGFYLAESASFNKVSSRVGDSRGGNSTYEGTGTCRSPCDFDPKNPEDTVAECSPKIRMER